MTRTVRAIPRRVDLNRNHFVLSHNDPHWHLLNYTMSDEKEKQRPSEPSPSMPVPMPAPMPVPVPVPVPTYPLPVKDPLKDETPVPPFYINSTRTVPPPPVPVLVTPVSARQYQEHLIATTCAAGHHDPTTKFGTCGIITAICCFPIGLLCLCADKETRCARCGVLLI